MSIVLPSLIGANKPAGGGAFTNQYSVSLDGTDDYVDCTNSTDFNALATAFTFSMWLKPSALSGYPMLIAKQTGSTGADTWQLFVDSLTSKPTIAVNFTGFVSSTVALSTGSWQHIAVSWQSGTGAVAFYTQGNPSGTGTCSTTMTTNTLPLCIGTKPRLSNFFNGLIDEVGIFSSVLSASQISNIYKGETNGGSGGTNGVPGDLDTFDPLGWWRMGDNNSGSGTTVTDQGNGGNNGTLKNIASPNGFVTDVPT